MEQSIELSTLAPVYYADKAEELQDDIYYVALEEATMLIGVVSPSPQNGLFKKLGFSLYPATSHQNPITS